MRSAFLILSDTKTFATKQDIRHTQTFESLEIQLCLVSKAAVATPVPESIRSEPTFFCGVMLFTLSPPLLSRCGGGMIALYGNSGAARRTHFFAS